MGAQRTRMTYRPTDLMDGYSRMVNDRVAMGFRPTFLTFMFNPLRLVNGPIDDQMRHEFERIYTFYLTRECRRPDRLPLDQLPLWIGCHDWPVPHFDRPHLRDVVVNGGRHLHGIALSPPHSRLRCTFEDLVDETQGCITGFERTLFRLHAQTIGKTPEVVVDYCLKSLGRKRTTSDSVLIMPRSKDERHWPVAG